jgi:predicted transcriptional regulator
MKELTKAQEDILKALWDIKDGAVSDVLDKLRDPKPAYNTVATVIKVLEKKGYVTHRTYGKTNVYTALVSRQEYTKNMMKSTISGLFNGSLNQMMSYFVKNKDISINEMEELKAMLDEEIKNQKK